MLNDDELNCINCSRPIMEHTIIPNAKGDITAPARVCPTATYRVTEETLNKVINAAVDEMRDEMRRK